MSEIDPDALLAAQSGERVTWGPAVALAGFLAALVAAVILGIPAELLNTAPAGEDLSAGAATYAQTAQVLAFILVPLIIATHGGGTIAAGLQGLGVRKPDRNPLGPMAIAVGIYLASLVIYSQIVTPPKQEDIADLFGPVWVQILLIVIGAAVSEELLFRGMLFGGFRKGMPKWVAVVLAGAIFGALHLPTGASAVPPLMIFGIVLCVLYDETGSILPGIVLHLINNSFALLVQ